MPTRKQRRRREKGRRHEYEDVYLDDAGNEISAEEYEALIGAAASDDKKPRGGRDAKPVRAGSRTIQPPSWRRVGKRTLIFAPLMFVVIMLLNQNQQPVATILTTLWMVLIFAPFSYVMDTLTYRMWRRRTGRADAARR